MHWLEPPVPGLVDVLSDISIFPALAGEEQLVFHIDVMFIVVVCALLYFFRKGRGR